MVNKDDEVSEGMKSAMSLLKNETGVNKYRITVELNALQLMALDVMIQQARDVFLGGMANEILDVIQEAIPKNEMVKKV